MVLNLKLYVPLEDPDYYFTSKIKSTRTNPGLQNPKTGRGSTIRTSTSHRVWNTSFQNYVKGDTSEITEKEIFKRLLLWNGPFLIIIITIMN